MREGETEGEKHNWLPLVSPQPGTFPSTQAWALTGNQTSDLFICGTTLSPMSHTSQARMTLDQGCCYSPRTLSWVKNPVLSLGVPPFPQSF